MFKRTKKRPTIPSNKPSMALEFSPNEGYLRELFADSADVFFDSFTFRTAHPINVTITACEGLVDTESLNRLVLERLDAFFENFPDQLPSPDTILHSLHLPIMKEVHNEEDLVSDIFSGKAIILFHGYDRLYSVGISNRPQRTPEDTATETTIKGPRDNFIEDVIINSALIRKRLRSKSLQNEQFEVGRRSLTKVSLLYVKDAANPEIVKGIVEKIKQIDVDGIYSGNQLMELIEKPAPLFPRYDYTGRPDTAVQSLLKGRIILLIDGISYAIITPANLFLLLKTGEDNEYNSVFASFERLLRIFGIFVAALLPGFWVAVTTFHQDQIPLILLATVVEARRGLPLPSSLEAIVMVIMFEIFREAGMRLPPSIGTTLSVLGGLIIGDAAIRSGLTSPAMLVVISGSIVATFTLVNQSLIGAISVLRLFTILFASFLGLFGYFFSLLFILIHLSNMRTFGIPYLDFTANLNLKNLLREMLRLPAKQIKSRPSMFSPEDKRPQGDGEQ